ncbi:AlpA family transcriptional regulator [Rhodoferax sp.]|uniref:helix-turn-helix transcriptional regulator n=1 Tax=Rhodoferax sp. TaxID=50421 RepID=UPI002726C466|nr:AlpA family transcriptional regulator [Rhodoferax sp.]MDO9199300.1 AlpA family transcriptional regulator [Rhodoferax sp.]
MQTTSHASTNGPYPSPHEGGVAVTPAKPGKLLRLPAVMERCALGRSSIYAGVKAGTFVAPVRLSSRAVAWREDEIDRWISERITTGTK